MTQTLQQQLKNDFFYDQQTGDFFSARKKRGWDAGKKVGSIDASRGYVQIWWKGSNKYAHRLAWLYVYGVLPIGIDHINGNKSDNKLSNLRVATQSENCQNLPIKQATRNHPIGVSFHKRYGKWASRIRKNKKEHFLGYFDSPEAAHRAYLDAKKSIHTFNPIPRELQA